MRIRDIITEEKFERHQQGMFSVYANSNFQLVGGMRSGSSPANVTRLRYIIFAMDIYEQTQDQKASEIGLVDLFIDDKTKEIEGLVNIELKPKFRKSGYGRQIIQDLKDSVEDGFNVYDIQKKAKKFWDKMGVEYPPNRKTTADHGRINK